MWRKNIKWCALTQKRDRCILSRNKHQSSIVSFSLMKMELEHNREKKPFWCGSALDLSLCAAISSSVCNLPCFMQNITRIPVFILWMIRDKILLCFSLSHYLALSLPFDVAPAEVPRENEQVKVFLTSNLECFQTLACSCKRLITIRQRHQHARGLLLSWSAVGPLDQMTAKTAVDSDKHPDSIRGQTHFHPSVKHSGSAVPAANRKKVPLNVSRKVHRHLLLLQQWFCLSNHRFCLQQWLTLLFHVTFFFE